jgi:hypothetical protein
MCNTSNEKRNAILGYYFPSFGIIELNPYVYNANNWIQSSTFAHEYLHFVQEISTASGFLSITKVKDLLNEVRVSTNNCLEAITTPHIVANELVAQDVVVYDILEGDGYKILEPYSIENIDITGSGFDCAVVLTINGAQYKFGVLAIQEMMADLFERTHPNYTLSNYAPYNLWEKICQYFKKELSNELMFHICWVSLDSANPGKSFIDIIRYFETNHPVSVEELYQMVESNAFDKVFNIELRSYLKTIAIESAKYLFSKAPSDFSKLYESFLNSSERLLSRNMKINLYRRGANSQLFQDLISQIGSSAITRINDYKDVVHLNGNDEHGKSISFALALREIYSSLLKDKNGYGCKLISYCENEDTIKDYISIDCALSPWRHCEKEKGCPYAIVWKTFGFVGKKLVKR